MGKVTQQAIRKAAETIRRGRLAAFPTETVYGLGANALDAGAVARIFAAKGRPSTSPLIVHVASVEAARDLASEWPVAAGVLAGHFWPGPLTIVLPKNPKVPDIVTAGLPTVGIRMPDHPIALRLIREAGTPIAAPSANPFAGLSPTEASHLRPALMEHVDCVLDGGATPVGIESTVISLAGPPAMLRPGSISRDEIEKLIGPLQDAAVSGEAHPSPGLHRKHYSPATRLILVERGDPPGEGRGAYLWVDQPADAARAIHMPDNAAAYAACLYSTLHELDGEGWDWIAVEDPSGGPEWDGVRDRLRRAAH